MPRVHRHTVDQTDAPSEEGNTMPTPPTATTTKASQNSKLSPMSKIGGGYQRRIVFLPGRIVAKVDIITFPMKS